MMQAHSLGWVNMIVRFGVPGKTNEGDMIRWDQLVLLLFNGNTDGNMKLAATQGLGQIAQEIGVRIAREVRDSCPPDRLKIQELLGHLRFYTQAIQNLYDLPEQEILQAFANAHTKRYLELQYTPEEMKVRLEAE